MVRLVTLAFAASVLSAPSLVTGLHPSDIPSDTPVSALLASAQEYLSHGRAADALVYYNAAVARDPSNYLTFFKRATTYLTLGRTAQATDDFNKVLELQPGFEGAHVQLGKLKVLNGDWGAAEEQYRVVNKDAKSDEVVELERARRAAQLAQSEAEKGMWEECVRHADAAIKIASRAAPLRELRSQCRFESGDIEGGVGDLVHVLQLRPGDTNPHVKIAAIDFYALNDRAGAMAQLRKCLHSDPESKICKRLLREMKKIDAAVQKTEKDVEERPATAVRRLVPTKDDEGLLKEIREQVQNFRKDGIIPSKAGNALLSHVVGLTCQCYYKIGSSKAREHCEESLQLDGNSLYGLLNKAKTQLDAEEFEAAVLTLKAAHQSHPDKEKIIRPLLQEAEIQLRRSKTKDYYKVLGVARDADEKQIKSAYRKMTKQHHPDKAVKQGLTKEEAEKKMAAINEAYEVLSNPELRARFDRGDDPNSHEQQNPFHGSFGHGSPFMFHQGGSGQRFQFQFGGGGGFPGGFPFG
ncbi:hypothetical protein VTK73DRAFT_4377 [Phialemonium thermophilum]|uniref:J domain-containing protein n=1 Tax=Phialemonium thermophilum TaxID=223376 RepID=A0ABR3Y0A4_9PEZI